MADSWSLHKECGHISFHFISSSVFRKYFPYYRTIHRVFRKNWQRGDCVIVIPNFITEKSPEYSLGFLSSIQSSYNAVTHTHTHTHTQNTTAPTPNQTSFIQFSCKRQSPFHFHLLPFIFFCEHTNRWNFTDKSFKPHRQKNPFRCLLNNRSTYRSVTRLTNKYSHLACRHKTQVNTNRLFVNFAGTYKLQARQPRNRGSILGKDTRVFILQTV